ncbi:MAG: VWA domain-containing protein [Actinobacteria bacterium]|nr:VWA domain-containing protein [Actinomycetota bacterium]
MPMVDRDRPSAGGSRPTELEARFDGHLRDPEEVLRRARELLLRPHDGTPDAAGGAGTGLESKPWTPSIQGSLDVAGTVEGFVTKSGALDIEDFRLLERERHTRNYVILVDHSGSMVGRKLELGATMAAVLAQLSAAGRADYAVVAFDDQLSEIKPLGEQRDVEGVVDTILRLPEGRATRL